MCPECGQNFAHRDTVKRHRLMKHPPAADFCGDSCDQQGPKRSRSLESSDPSTTDSTAQSMMETEDDLPILDVGKLTITDVLRPPSPASPITRGFIRPPKTVPFKPSSNKYYTEDTAPRLIINRDDDLPVPSRLKLQSTDAQGTPKADFFKQSCYSYKTLAEAIYQLEDSFYPKCCLRGERSDYMD